MHVDIQKAATTAAAAAAGTVTSVTARRHATVDNSILLLADAPFGCCGHA